jgi:signal transduction histidine kinase
MSKKKISLRSRILLIMLSFIFVLFLVVLAVFNLLVREHIKNSVNEQLRGVLEMVHGEREAPRLNPDSGRWPPEQRFDFFPDMRRFPRGLVGSAQAIVVSADYELLFPTANMYFLQNYDDINALVAQMAAQQLDLQNTEVIKLNAAAKEYYLVSVGLRDAGLRDWAFFVYYVDMTAIASFAGRINAVLLAVMGLAGTLAVGTAVFLSGNIARPIGELTQFAARIGRGDFSLNSASYREVELADLAESMNKAAAQLDAYDREQKTFFQNVSHELRTPLQAIRSSAEGIEHGILDVKQSTRIIISEADRLGDMVEDLLYLSRIDSLSRNGHFVECDLREVLSNCAERQRNLALERGLEFIFKFDKEPVPFSCDEKHMFRAFANLISNAIRYAQSRITLSCHQTGRRIITVVADDGPGIDPKDQPYIFDRFYKGKGGKHGIGLSIVKAIIEEHGGQIEPRTTAQGTSFVITFPL